MADPQFSQDDIRAELARRQAMSPTNGQDFSGNSNYQQLAPYVSQTEQKYGLPSGLLANTAGAESSWNPQAVNPDSGATGLMQFMPATAKQLGIDPTDPMQSIDAAGQYYQHLIQQHNGDVPAAVAAYGGFKTKDPSEYQAKVIPQGYYELGSTPSERGASRYASNSAPTSTNPQQTQSDALPFTKEEIQAELARRQASGDGGSAQRGEFNKGVRRSIADTANLMENAIPAWGKSAANELFGTDFDNKQDLIDYAKRSDDITKEYPAKVGSISDINSPSDIISYLAGQIGENVAGLIPMVGEGYLGAKLMTPALETISKEAAAKYLVSDAGKKAAETAGGALTENKAKLQVQQQIAAKMGALTVVGAMAPQQMAGEYVNLMGNGQDDPMGAALIGGLEAGIYMLPGMSVINDAMGKLGSEAASKAVADGAGAATRTEEQLAARGKWQESFDALRNHPAVQDAMKDAAYLGATGMASETIGVLGEGVLGANPDIFSKDNFVRIVNSGINGAVGGAMLGGGVGLARGKMPDMDIRNLAGANKDEGTKRTTLDTGEVQSKGAVSTGQVGEQLKANLVTSQGLPTDNVNISSGLLDPSLLWPSQMTEEHRALAKQAGITTEDLWRVTDPHQSEEEKVAALDKFFSPLKRTPAATQLTLPFEREGQISALMKQYPDIDRAAAEKQIDALNQFRIKKRDTELAKEGAKFNKDGTITRTVTADTLKDRPAWVENPEAKVRVNDSTKAAEAVEKAGVKFQAAAPDVADLFSKIDKEQAKSKDLVNALGGASALGNYHSDVVTPIRVNEALSYIPLSDEAKKALKSFADEGSRITRELSGKIASFMPVKKVIDNLTHNPVLGAQYLHTVMTAFPEHLAEASQRGVEARRSALENIGHENAHLIYDHIFSDAERKIVQDGGEQMRDAFLKDPALSLKPGDFDALLASPEGRAELFANHVGKELVRRTEKTQDQMKHVPFILRPLVKRVLDFTDKFRAMVRGTTNTPFHDLVKSTLDGKYAKDHINDAMDAVQRGRLARISSHFQAALGDEHDKAMDEVVSLAATKPYNGLESSADAAETFNDNRDTNPRNMSLIGAFVASNRWVADNAKKAGKIFAPIYNLYKEGQAETRRIMEGSSKLLNGGYQQLNKSDRYLVHNVLDAVASSEGKIAWSKDGFAQIPYDSSSMKSLPFDHANLKDGDVIPLKDVDLNKGLKALQDTYRYILDQKSDKWRDMMSKSFATEGLSKDFTKADLEATKAKLDPEKLGKELYDKKIAMLDTASSDIDGLARMQKMDYVPRIRYGQHAYYVQHKSTEANKDAGIAGDTVALHMVENGFFSHSAPQFDKGSLAKAQAALKPYLDRPDLYNVYDSKGRITKDKVTGEYRPISNPDFLNYDKIKSHYGMTGDNLAMIAGHLNSRGVDMTKFEELRDMVATEAGRSQFGKMFKPSEKIAGYSQDWDRVIHSYLTSNAHFLGDMEFNRNLPEFQKIFNKIEDPILRKRAQDQYGDGDKNRGYMGSGKSDYGTLRTINYLYCMGGNVSSLLVEAFKVPTVTLGTLNQLRANSLKNMALLGQLSARFYSPAALKLVGENRSQFGGHTILPLTNDAYLKAQMGDDKELINFTKNSVAHFGNITEANAVRAYGGQDTQGSETTHGPILNTLNRIQTLLSIPLSIVEQGNRLMSYQASYITARELEQSRPGQLDKLFQNSSIYQDLRMRNPDWKPWQAAAMYLVDEENGAPGKVDRSPYLQGIGGAFLQPFFSFDHQALENICKMVHRGADGKRALGVMMGAFALTAGIQGLPGMHLLVKGGQALQNTITGTDPDWEQASREMMSPYIGSRNALMVTNGLMRAYGGTEISQRISLPLPGEDLLLNLLGVEAGKTSSVLGVEGSMIQNATNSWRAYMNGQSAAASLGNMLPNSIGNLERAYQLTQRGAMNNLGGNATRAIPPDQLSNWSVVSRALGMTSDQIATANEQIYAEKMKGKMYETADHRFTQQAEMAYMQMADAQRQGDSATALEAQQRFAEVLKSRTEFAQEHGIPWSSASFINQLRQSYVQRQMPTTPTKAALGGKLGITAGHSLGTYGYFQDLKGER